MANMPEDGKDSLNIGADHGRSWLYNVQSTSLRSLKDAIRVVKRIETACLDLFGSRCKAMSGGRMRRRWPT